MSEKFENVAGASAKTMNVFAIGSYMIGSLQLCHRSFPSWLGRIIKISLPTLSSKSLPQKCVPPL